jgi:hypothetical protein
VNDSTSVSGGDGFSVATDRYRRELHVHCYRMLVSCTASSASSKEASIR